MVRCTAIITVILFGSIVLAKFGVGEKANDKEKLVKVIIHLIWH